MKYFILSAIFFLTISASAIVGGRLVNVNDPESRPIVYVHKSMGKKSSYCTGTLISENLVLTAAHCVYSEDHASKATPDQIQIYFGTNPMIFATAKLQAVQIYARDGYTEDSKNDVAIIRFAGTRPIGTEIARLPTASDVLAAQMYGWTAIGYGLTDGDRNAKHNWDWRGVLHMAKIEHVKQRDPRTLSYDESNGVGACFGDSGGPGLIRGNDGQWVIIAISRASYYGLITGIFGGDKCSSRADYTAMLPFASSIKPLIEQVQ